MTSTTENTESFIFVRTHRREFGPFSETELVRHISGGRIPFSAWLYRGEKWELLAEIEPLRQKHPDFENMPKDTPKVSRAAPRSSEEEITRLVEVSRPTAQAASGAIRAGGASTVSAEPVWFVVRDKKKFGPYSSADIIGQLQHKDLDSSAFVWRPGFATWQRLTQVPEFSRENMRKLVNEGAALDVVLKRKHLRAPFEVEVIAHDNTRAIEGKTMVIGEGGLFLSVARPLHPVGARLKLHFTEAETPAFNAVAEVVSVVRGEVQGYCLKFVAIADADRRRIAKFTTEKKPEGRSKR